MKCPNDQTEMELGKIAPDIGGYVKWVSNSGKIFSGLFGGGSGKELKVYRCSKCGKVELTTEPDKEDK